MEEWLSGVTQLIDKRGKLDFEQTVQATGLENIEDRLEILIKKILETQVSIERPSETQEKGKDKDSKLKLKE
jgi:hypothetical protein